jgi:AcrR family transcriptional regulator
MTERKETILSIALNLFATQGYESTPTSQIAKEAQVSEGLIFRHFTNKEGLLQALIEQGQARVQVLVESILQETDARRVIARIIDLPIQLIQQEREFWSLQFSLKYRNHSLPATTSQAASTQAISNVLYNAFDTLGYDYPDKETEYLMVFLEGVSSVMVAHGQDVSSLVRFIKVKYGVVESQHQTERNLVSKA